VRENTVQDSLQPKNLDDGSLLIRCDCGMHVAEIMVEMDTLDGEADSLYLSFGTLYIEEPVFSWSNFFDRIKTCWAILCGRSHWFNEIIIRDREARQIAEYLNSKLSPQ
jgi:hypothetical protein